MSDVKYPEDRQRSNMPAVLDAAFPALAAPSTPEWLPASLHAAWTGLWASPVAQLLDPVSDLPAVTRLFRLYEIGEKLDKRMDGELELDPADVAARVRVSAELRQLEAALGLSPRARLALGLALLAGRGKGASLDDASDAANDD